MGYKSTGGSLPQQVHKRLQGMEGYGRSKHDDKTLGIDGQYIYSFSTMETYTRHCNYFVNWCKENPACKEALGHKPRTLEECEPYVEAWIREQEGRGLSAYTVKMEKSALAKLYGHDFDFKTKETRRQDIKRSRRATVGDKHFSEKNNAAMVNACRSVGFRRSELKKAQASDLHQEGEVWLVRIKGKGGRVRDARVMGTPEEVEQAVEYIKTLDGHNHVHSNADIHGYRADYATKVYNYYAQDIKALKGQRMDYTAATGKTNEDGSRIEKSAIYYCRGEEKGKALDRAAMIKASQYLGHNRESVVGEHYIRIADQTGAGAAGAAGDNENEKGEG